MKSLPAVDRALLRAAAVEVTKLERRLPLLATTASITPFIGLFGTVWGIMTSFQGIAQRGFDEPRRGGAGHCGGADRDGRGPVRGDPGRLLLQPLLADVKDLTAAMDDFALEFLNIAERNFT